MDKDSIKTRIKNNCVKNIKQWLILDGYENEVRKKKFGYWIDGIDIRIYSYFIYLSLDIIELENETVKIALRTSVSFISLLYLLIWSIPLLYKIIFKVNIPIYFTLLPLIWSLFMFINYFLESRELYKFVNKLFEDVAITYN